MSNDDYGYFGSGDEGYAHYVAASGEDGGEDEKNGGGGGGGRGRPPGNKGFGKIGWIIVLGVLIIYAILTR
ncbi:hypothetical protein MASR2M70_11980 [Bacillota bacterium]